MANHVYSISEVVGSSPDGIDGAQPRLVRGDRHPRPAGRGCHRALAGDGQARVPAGGLSPRPVGCTAASRSGHDAPADAGDISLLAAVQALLVPRPDVGAVGVAVGPPTVPQVQPAPPPAASSLLLPGLPVRSLTHATPCSSRARASVGERRHFRCGLAPPAVLRRHASLTRTMPSWAVVATSVPSCAYISPIDRPRPLTAEGDCWA